MTDTTENQEQAVNQDTPQEDMIPASEVAGLKSALIKERENVKKAGRIFEELGITPDEVKELVAARKQQEQANAEKRGEYEKILKRQQEEAAKEIEQYKAQASQAMAAYQAGVVQTQLMQELVSAGATQEAIKLLPTILQNRTKLDTVDGSLSVRVLDANGEVMVTAKGEAGIADLVQEAIKEYPGLFKAPVKSGSGKQPGSVAGSASSKTVTRSRFDQMSQFERAQFARDGGKVVND